jgi:hypothetical protein
VDDAKLHNEIKTSDDIDNLQFNIYLLSAWAKSWHLEISISKCSAMDISLRNKVDSYCENTVDGSALKIPLKWLNWALNSIANNLSLPMLVRQ